MGGDCSQIRAADCGANGRCQCFSNGKINDINVIRYPKSRWIWSKSHSTALIDGLSDFHYLIPKDIMHLIKDHSFHPNEEYFCLSPVVCKEKCYSNYSDLLRKKLCRYWYSQQSKLSLLIAIYVSNDKNSDDMFNVLNAKSLPSLQYTSRYKAYMDKYNQIKRTVFVNKYQIGLHLISVNHKQTDGELVTDSDINMIIVDEDDALLYTNEICKGIWDRNQSMKNCIIVKVERKTKLLCNNCEPIRELAKYWNIPCISVCLSKDETINDMFSFAVKYYWFCNVVM